MTLKDLLGSDYDEIPKDCLPKVEQAFKTNQYPGFVENSVKTMRALIERRGTGSYLFFPGLNNYPNVCRMTFRKMRQHVREQYMDEYHFAPFFVPMFKGKTTEADFIGFCIVAEDLAGLMFEWEGLAPEVRRGNLPPRVLPYFTPAVMQKYESDLRKYIRAERKRYASEAV